MSSTSKYHPKNLDFEGDWIHDLPSAIKGIGGGFGQCCTTPSPERNINNSRHAMDESLAYPDPTTASLPHTQPYFDPQSHLNPKALPFFAPPNNGALQQEKTQRWQAPGEQNASEVLDDINEVPASRAATRASKSVSKSRRRRSSAHQPALQRRPPPQHTDNTAKTNRALLRQQLRESTLTANTQPLDVPNWATNNTNAYHAGVGRVQMRMPPHPAPDDQGPAGAQDTDLSKESDVVELFPCTHQGCTSKHKPFMTRGPRDKHMKSHESKDQLPHRCTVCGRYFRYPREVDRHQSVHSNSNNDEGQGRISCPRCPGTFSRDDNLKRHFRTCHPHEMMPITPPRTYASGSTNPVESSYEIQYPPLPPPTPPSSIGRS